MLLRIDPGAPTALFTQITDSLRSQIYDGTLVAGERLPSAKTLAAELSLNIHTVLHALHQLRDEGLIELHRGRGAIVLTARRDLGALPELISELVVEARRVGIARSHLITMIGQEYPA